MGSPVQPVEAAGSAQPGKQQATENLRAALRARKRMRKQLHATPGLPSPRHVYLHGGQSQTYTVRAFEKVRVAKKGAHAAAKQFEKSLGSAAQTAFCPFARDHIVSTAKSINNTSPRRQPNDNTSPARVAAASPAKGGRLSQRRLSDCIPKPSSSSRAEPGSPHSVHSPHYAPAYLSPQPRPRTTNSTRPVAGRNNPHWELFSQGQPRSVHAPDPYAAVFDMLPREWLPELKKPAADAARAASPPRRPWSPAARPRSSSPGGGGSRPSSARVHSSSRAGSAKKKTPGSAGKHGSSSPSTLGVKIKEENDLNENATTPLLDKRPKSAPIFKPLVVEPRLPFVCGKIGKRTNQGPRELSPERKDEKKSPLSRADSQPLVSPRRSSLGHHSFMAIGKQDSMRRILSKLVDGGASRGLKRLSAFDSSGGKLLKRSNSPPARRVKLKTFLFHSCNAESSDKLGRNTRQSIMRRQTRASVDGTGSALLNGRGAFMIIHCISYVLQLFHRMDVHHTTAIVSAHNTNFVAPV